MENKKFNNVINEAISNVSDGLSHKMDLVIMQDLKRMSDLGVLQIEHSQPDYIDCSLGSFKMAATIYCRLKFIGEETIEAQQKEIEQHKAEKKILHFGLNNSVETIKKLDKEIEQLKVHLKDESENLRIYAEKNTKLKQQLDLHKGISEGKSLIIEQFLNG
jgi:septal ring factor EnvC (AmiA/AmiB activator)